MWDVNLTMPRNDEKIFLVNASKLVSDEGPVFQIGHDSIPSPIAQCDPPQVKVLELFAGGCGGWSVECRFITSLTGTDFQTVAVERDIHASRAYAVSRNAPIWNGMSRLPIHGLASVKQDVLICADVQCLEWVPCVAVWAPDFACISAPCKPWSGAANGQGNLFCLSKSLLPCRIHIRSISLPCSDGRAIASSGTRLWICRSNVQPNAADGWDWRTCCIVSGVCAHFSALADSKRGGACHLWFHSLT